MPGIDLHTHSNASDGEHSPARLVQLAAQAQLAAIALTDHDTLDGLEEALDAGQRHGIEVIPGCELSVADQGRHLHILGLWTGTCPHCLANILEELRQGREERNRRILDKLASLGVDINYEELRRAAKGTVGRPHIAGILVARGLSRNPEAAFRRYLGKHGQAYVRKRDLPLDQAAAALRQAGATVALAHPYLLGESGPALEKLLAHYKTLGVDAIEAYYTEHSPQKIREYLTLAERLDLGVCGGSDYHGQAKPAIRLGVGKGSLHVPESVLDNLKTRRARQNTA